MDKRVASSQKLVAVERVERTVVKRTQRTEVNGSVVDASVEEFVSESSDFRAMEGGMERRSQPLNAWGETQNSGSGSGPSTVRRCICCFI